MDIAIIDEVSGYVVTVVALESLDGYDPGDGLIAIDATGQTAYAGCTWTEASGFVEPPPHVPSKADLVAYTANKRWLVEAGGIVVGGVPVATDDRSKIMIIGARVKADADANFTAQWKLPSGDFLTINAATIIGISDAVLAHVDASFAAEAAVLAEIAAGTITTTAEIDAAAWPA